MSAEDNAPSSPADRAFERALLAAGRAERLPEQLTPEAWATFAASTAALNVASASLAAAGQTPAPAAAASGLTSAWQGPAAKWLVLGMFGGSALTVAWLNDRGTSEAPQLSLRSAPPAAPPAVSPTTAVVDGAPEPVPLGKATLASSPVSSVGPATLPPAKQATTPKEHVASKASSLAAEVAAVDAIRTAIAMGAWGDAHRLIRRYRREAAAGELRAEVDVLYIETLSEEGRKLEARDAAQAFLARHPQDPQAARVRWLAR